MLIDSTSTYVDSIKAQLASTRNELARVQSEKVD